MRNRVYFSWCTCWLIGEQSLSIVKILLPALVASAIYAVLRGGLWGRKYFFTISFTEFFEQLVRIIFIFVLFNIPSLDIGAGEKSALSLTLSAVASCILVVVLYFAFNGRLSFGKNQLKTTIKTSTPITFVKSASAVVGSVIATILPARLMLYGYNYGEALSYIGIFLGMVLPLIMVPSTFISSISVALVPEISAHTNNIDKGIIKNIDGLKNEVVGAIKTTITICFLLIPAFIILGNPICEILFASTQAGTFLSVFACIMLPMGLNQIVTSMLNALGLEKKALVNYCIGAAALLVCVIFLPKYIGAYAMGLGFALMHTISAMFGLMMLSKRKIIDKSVLKTMLVCSIISCPVCALTYFTYNIFSRFLPLFFATAISGVVCEIFMVLLMFVFNVASLKVWVVKLKRRQNKQKVAVWFAQKKLGVCQVFLLFYSTLFGRFFGCFARFTILAIFLVFAFNNYCNKCNNKCCYKKNRRE